MTEAEWLACEEPGPLLRRIASDASARKARLLRVAAARLEWDAIAADDLLRDAVEAAERYADGEAADEQLKVHVGSLYGFFTTPGPHPRRDRLRLIFLAKASVSPDRMMSVNAGSATWATAVKSLGGRLTPLVRDVFGNPFRPVAFSASWRSSTVLALASTIYADRRFDLLPVLADALEESGCESAEVLTHCREHGVHVRGCWVIDGVLGKS